jgi:hypothetical protein
MRLVRAGIMLRKVAMAVLRSPGVDSLLEGAVIDWVNG